MNKTISILAEGGIGDCLASNRFIPAIFDTYGENNIFNLYFNTEGGETQKDLLEFFWPSWYLGRFNSFVLPKRKTQKFHIESQFGSEIWNAHIENIQEDWLKKIRDCDILIDLHIDGLNWCKSEINWLQYYYSFPRPQVDPPNYTVPFNNYILLHLYSRLDSPYNLEPWYISRLIDDLVKKTEENIIIITQEPYVGIYNKWLFNDRVYVCTPDLYECFTLAKKCSIFFGIDSGIRYIPLHYGKPTYVFSKNCFSPGNIIPSHLFRWLIFKNFVFPINYSTTSIVKIISNIKEHPAHIIFPEYIDTHDIRDVIVDRDIIL